MDSGLQSLIAKLGHPLEEIRTRSLRNIISKLDYNLISIKELSSDNQFISRLLELFNFRESRSEHVQVLNLILKFSKSSTGAESLRNLGGVSFLTALRNDVEASSQPLIDEILESLISECRPLDDDQCLHREVTTERSQFVSGQRVISSQQTQIELENQFSPARIFANENHDQNYACHGESYFEESSPQTCLPHSGFYFTLFPWLSLTTSDKHVLASASESLQSQDAKEVINLCNFLRNVVFQDFPAEVFLQRPHIFNTLLRLIRPVEDRVLVVVEVVQSLQLLTTKIKSRIKFHWDPATHHHRSESVLSTSQISTQESEITSSSDSRPSLVGQSVSRSKGDGENDGSVVSQSEKDLIEDDILQLQLIQISVPEFCIRVLNASLSLFQTSDVQLSTLGLQLINEAVEVVEVSFAHIWDDFSTLARGVIEEIQTFFKTASSLLQRFQITNEPSEKSFATERCLYLSLLTACLRCLSVIATPEQIYQNGLDKNFSNILECALFDTCFRLNYPDLHSILEVFVEQENASIYLIYVKTKSVCDALEPASRLLYDNEASDIDLIKFARSSLLAWPYLKNNALANRLVHVLSQSSLDDEVLAEGKSVLLDLMMHMSQLIRLTIYGACLSLIKEIINVKQVADTNLDSSWRLRFLLDTSVLKAVFTSGFCDSNAQVAELSREIVTYLIQSKLLLASDVWDLFVASLTPLLPVIQGFADTRSAAGRCIGFLTQISTSPLSRIELLRGNIRLMFHSDYQRRCETLQNLTWFLNNEKNPNLQIIDISSMPNLLITETLLNINARYFPSIYELDHFKNVFAVVSDSEMEFSIRKSAMKQLSEMLEDPNLHDSFIEQSGVDIILQFISSIFNKQISVDCTEKDSKEMLSSCFSSLLTLVIHNKTLRDELFERDYIYLQLLRAAFLFDGQFQTHLNICALLAILIFNQYINETESIPPPEGGDFVVQRIFSLPSLIISRYKIPFKAIAEVERTKEEENHELWLIDSARCMMKVAWDSCYEHENLPPAWTLSSLEHQTVTATDLVNMIEETLSQIRVAVAHAQVRSALLTLRLQLIAASFHRDCRRISSLPWRESFERFLNVTPHSKADKRLLREILTFLIFIVNGNIVDLAREITTWFQEILANTKSVMYQLLSADPIPISDSDSRNLNNVLVNVVTAIGRDLKVNQELGNIVMVILRTLSTVEGAHFYNLASLETIIRCLMHLTARPGWSRCCSEMTPQLLCAKVLSALMDVVASFHISLEITNYSLMGKGVTHAAIMCLQHLVAEMAGQIETEDWIQLWLSQNEVTAGLTWLVPLWMFRDPEIRAASLGIAVGLAATSSGCHALMMRLDRVAGGIWGAAFTFLLDHNEASCVKEQSALLLINLTDHLLSSDGTVHLTMRDTSTQELLLDVNALRALLQHSNFFMELSRLAAQYYPHFSLQFFPSESSDDNDTVNGNNSSDDLESLDNVPGEPRLWHHGRPVTTPFLVAALCKLLNNLILLLPNETFSALKDFLMETLLKCLNSERLLLQFKNETIPVLFLSDVIHMHSEILKMMADFAREHPKNSFVNNSFIVLINNLLNLEFVHSQPDLKNDVYTLWHEIYNIMLVVIDIDYELASKFNWLNVMGNVHHILRECSETKVWLSCIEFIGNYCHRNQATNFVSFLDIPNENYDAAFGASLSQLVLTKYKEKYSLSDQNFDLQTAIVNSFSALLSISETAKRSAISGGLIQFEVDRLKDIYIQFTLLSLENAKISSGSGKKERETHWQRHLILHFDLLAALLYNMPDAKVECSDKGLSGIIHQLWIWCRPSEIVMKSLLSLLCTYTAHCKISVRSVAYTSPMQTSGVLKSLGSHSLVHALVRLTTDEIDRATRKNDVSTLVLMFRVLSNLCQGSECRSILCKANFLEEFTNYNNKKNKKNKYFQVVQQLWLNLLLSMTFAPDGQEAILRIPGILDVLMELAESGLSLSLLVLRNLACSSNKSHLLNSDLLVGLLIKCVVDGPLDNKAVSASALWALAANCQKAKMMLKNMSWISQLQQTKTQLEKSKDSSFEITVQHLNNLFQIIEIKS